MKSNVLQSKFPRRLTSILVALFLVGCSGAPPESAAKRIVESEIQNQSNGLIKLVGFRKTNATRDDRIYKMEFETEIEYIDDALDFGNYVAKKGDPVPQNSTVKNRKKGERVKRSGTVTFERTERGWRAPDGNVY